MGNRRNDFILGLVVLALLALFVTSVIFIYPRIGSDTRVVTVHFWADRGVAPLKPGSAVMLGGALQVGKVTRVARTVVAEQGVPVVMIDVQAEIERDLKLYQDCRISTSQPPVGGAGLIDILTVGTAGTAEVGLTPEAVIRGQPAQGLNAAIAQLSDALFGEAGLVPKLDALIDPEAEGSLTARLLVSLDDLNEMTAALRLQLSPDEQRTLLSKLHAIMDNVVRTTQALGDQMDREDQATLLAKTLAAMDRIETGLDEAVGILRDTRPTLTRTVENIGELSDALNDELLATARAQLNPADPESLLGKVHTAMTRLNASMANIETATTSGRDLLVANQPELDVVVQNLRATSEEVRGAMEEIRAAPWRLLLPPAGDQRDALVFNAAQSFARAAASLDHSARRLETALGRTEGAAEQEDIRTILQDVRQSFDLFEQAERQLWEQLR